LRYRALSIIAAFTVTGCERSEPPSEMTAEQVAEQLAAVKVDPGQWESSTKILSASGALPPEALNQMVGQETRTAHCITPEQAARPNANFLAAQQGSDCTYQDFRMQDGKLSGRMTCSGGQLPAKMTTSISGDYGSQRYDLVMDMKNAGIGGSAALQIKARTQGRRVGECRPGG
jgi:hypothetical protein